MRIVRPPRRVLPHRAVTRLACGLVAAIATIAAVTTPAVAATAKTATASHAATPTAHAAAAATPLPRTGWSVTASSDDATDVPANMLDGNENTRWSTGTAQTPGQYFIVDMGSATSINSITMDSGPSTGDYARGYAVFLSTDGTDWGSAVASGAGSSSLVSATFATQSAQYIKVEQTGSAGNWWSIAEFNAYDESIAAGTWVGAWQAAMAGGGNAVTNQTIRMVVHLTAGGTDVRVRLSNIYGTTALPIGAVDVAEQQSGGNAVPGTHHTATFGGSTTTSVPAGAEAASDPIPMSVTPEENLLVSVYYPGGGGASSWHYLASDTTYYSASGNFASDDTTANYPASDNSWYYVDGVDVDSTTSTGTLVAFGDSITDGAYSTVGANERWPNFLAQRLEAQSGGPVYGVVDAGIGGNRLLTDTGDEFGTSALHRFQHDALGEPNVKAVILLEGINDIGTNIGPNGGALTAQDLINGYQTLIAQAHAAGVKIYGGTILPYSGAGYYTAAGETIRETVNNWILTSGAFDGTVDFASALANPSNSQQLNPAYDSGDHLHPNDAGYQAMANAINLAEITGSTSGGSGGTGGATGATGQITGYGGQCVDVTNASSADGTQVQLWSCTGGTNQQWTVGADGTIQSLGKCMSIPSGQNANGTRVVIDTCNGTSAQQWSATASGQLVNTQSGTCLDATGPSSANGTPLQIWACTGGSNQVWTLPSA
jgi:lysophospholipase L1-like esterase